MEYLDRAAKFVAQHEGFRTQVYDDATGKPAHGNGHSDGRTSKLTIGYGRNLEDRGITRAEAEYLLRNDLIEIYDQLKKYRWFYEANDARQIAFLDMAYNLGVAGLLKFKRMLQAATERDWARAAEEAKDSAWYSQVKSRGVAVVRVLQNGHLN